MDWQMENRRDAQILELRSLAPLNGTIIAAASTFTPDIEKYNGRVARAAARLGRLAEKRLGLADFKAWQDADGAAIADQRSQVRCEAWDAMVQCRRLLRERERLLVQIERGLQDQRSARSQEHDKAVMAAERRLAAERHALQEANPLTASSHLADLVDADDAVHTAGQRRDAARIALQEVASARHAITSDECVVTARQREVFLTLVS